jgi:predicted phage terminase large subunit-like protein
VQIAHTENFLANGLVTHNTRWHLDDLTGYVTEGHGSDEPPAEDWEVVNIPALAEEGDPLGRLPGEPLWPEKYDREALAAMERQMPPRWWLALMQGAPVAAEGNLLHVTKIGHRLPPEGKRYQAWDLAISEKTTADWSVGMTISVDDDNNIDLLDERRGRWGFNDVLEQIADFARIWDPVSVGIETTAFQAAVFQEASRRYLLPFREVKCDRDKVVRAQLLADRIDGGKVFANKTAPWWRGWETEARDFPQGGHDDRIDSTAHAVRMVSVKGWYQDPATMAMALG